MLRSPGNKSPVFDWALSDRAKEARIPDLLHDIKGHQQMLFSLADAQRLNEAGTIAALLGGIAIHLVIKLR